MWYDRSPGSRLTTRVFSSRYVWMMAPLIWPARPKMTSIHLPYRDELSLRTVRALPNDSRI